MHSELCPVCGGTGKVEKEPCWSDMRTAKDGKPFDIDTIGELGEDEVELIQFLRPNAKRRRMAATVGREFVTLAQNQILSCEDLGNGSIAIYSRGVSESEEDELTDIAVNGPGENSPTNVLIRVIKKANNGPVQTEEE